MVTGCAGSLILAWSTLATSTNYSIGINFAADQLLEDNVTASPLAPAERAGVPGVQQLNWNNFSNAVSTAAQTLIADTNDTAVPTSATVAWFANGTWSTTGSRGAAENNGTNFFPGTPDHKLMAGYLDVTGAGTPTTVTLRGLPPELTSGAYYVYVYSMGGARANRGGSIRITDTNGNTLKPYQLKTDIIGPTNYVKDPGLSHTVPGDTGDYMVFTNVFGSDIVIEATIAVNPNTGTPRAPINAVQLVAANLSQPLVSAITSDARHRQRNCVYLRIGSSGAAHVQRQPEPIVHELPFIHRAGLYHDSIQLCRYRSGYIGRGLQRANPSDSPNTKSGRSQHHCQCRTTNRRWIYRSLHQRPLYEHDCSRHNGPRAD